MNSTLCVDYDICMSKIVLVTGAAGFLGSHLSKKHLDAGDLVLGLDNFCSSNSSSKHLLDLKAHPNFTFERADIANTFYTHHVVQKFINGPGASKFIDVIYNFACPASPPTYQSMPVETMMTCVAGTKNILDIARLNKSVLVQASTSEVNGDPDTTPQPETYRGNVNSYGCRSCYDEGKRAAEALCWDYKNKHNVDARVVRIFNTYGPQMLIGDGRVVTNFIKQGMANLPLTVYGDGSQTRSFCYVDDLIDGVTKLAALDNNPGTPINIGNPNEFTILQLAQQIKAIFHNDIVFSDLPSDDPTQRCPDISLANSILGWEPNVQLDTGLSQTISYFRSIIQ